MNHDDLNVCNNCDAATAVADDPRGYCADCIADTDGPTIIIWDRDVDADDRLVLREHHDRIVVNELADGKFEVLPYSALYDSPGRTVLTIVIRDSRPGETLRTTCDAETLRLLIAEALDRAETMGRFPYADQVGIYVEDVVTIAG